MSEGTQGSTTAADATASFGTPAASSAPATVPTLPGYDIEGVLGRGGMGVVYRARHLALKREVALKMILAGGHAGEAELARFKAEAEAVARLQHPNIVQVFEVGEHEGRPFMALELCPGGSLAACLKGEPLPAREAAEVVAVLARAVQHAHEHGIVHRDLKPANVLLAGPVEPAAATASQRRRGAAPKLTDFGLARKLDEVGQTVTGAILGTPSYMAPEQADGRVDALGPAVDVYALGAVLYECLVGRPPFRGATTLATLDLVRHTEPVAPRQLNPAVPTDLETVCLKCLRKEPRQRYASAAELADDLERFLRGEPITARPVGAVERAVKWARRHPAVATLTGLLVVAFAVLVGGGVWFTLSLDAQVRAEKAAREQATTNEGLANANAARATANEKKAEARLRLSEALRYGGLLREAEAARAAGRFLEALDALSGCDWGLCGWEYDLMRRRLARWEGLLPGGGGGPTCYAYSPVGNFFASGDETGYRLTAPGQRPADHVRVPLGVSGLAFAPDGRALALAAGSFSRPAGAGTLHLIDPAGVKPAVVRRLPAAAWGVAWSADGERLATAGQDGVVRLWTSRGEPAGLCRGHAGPVHAVAFVPGGVVSGGGDGTVRLWDADGTEQAVLRYPGGPVHAVAVAPDGSRLAAGGVGGAVRLWALSDREVAGDLRGLDGPVRGLAFSPDGTLLAGATGGPGGGVAVSRLCLWEAATGAELASLPLPGHGRALAFAPDAPTLTAGIDGRGGSWSLDLRQAGGYAVPASFTGVAALSPDGSRLAVASRLEVRVLEAATGLERFTLRGHATPVQAIAFDAASDRLATGSLDGTIRLWDARTGALLPVTASVPDREVRALAFSPDGTLLASGGGHPDVVGRADFRFWDAATGRLVRALESADHSVLGHTVAFTPDGKYVVGAASDAVRRNTVGEVRVWETATGAVARTTTAGLTVPIRGAVVSTDGSRLAVCGGTTPGPGRIVLMPLRGEGPATELRSRAGVLSVAFHPGGRLFTGEAGGTVRVWDAATGTELLALETGSRGVVGLAVDQAGRRLAGACFGGTVRVWDAGPPAGHRLAGFAFPPSAVAFAPDGSVLAVAGGSPTERSDAGELVLFDATTGRVLHALANPAGAVPVVAFGPGGRLIAVGGRSGVVATWDVDSGQPRGVLAQVGTPIRALAYSPDGRRLAYAHGTSTIRLHLVVLDLDTGTELLALDAAPASPPLSWSPDGGAVVLGAERREAWDVATGEPIDATPYPVVPQADTARSPDGRWEAVCLRDVVHVRPKAEAAEPQRERETTLAWHTDRAEHALRDKDWHAARHHLDRLLAAVPDSAALHARRAGVWAALGRRDRALADLAHPALRTSRDPEILAAHARACLVLRDPAGYQAARAALLTAGPTPDREVALRAGWACAVGEANGDGDRVLALVEDAAKLAGDAAARPLAAALLRAGRHADAEKVLQGVPGRQPAEELLLALVHAHLGRADEARRDLARAKLWFDRRLLRSAVEALGTGSLNPLMAVPGLLAPEVEAPLPGESSVPTAAELSLLRAEAERLLGR